VVSSYTGLDTFLEVGYSCEGKRHRLPLVGNLPCRGRENRKGDINFILKGFEEIHKNTCNSDKYQ
jgi:hypothetical protein